MITLEHTLVILLLLVGLLNAKPKLPRFAWWAIVGALALALIAPATPIILPWEWLSALLIPILLWQAAGRLAGAHLPLKLREVALWLGLALGIGGVVLLTSELTGAGSFMFGLLTASMVWRATEEVHQPTHLGQVGPLALAFLLAEIAPAVEAPGRYMLALLAGAGVGALVGYVAVHAAQRMSPGSWQNLLSIGQVYLGYGLAVFLGLSGVVAALMCVAVYVAYGTKRGLWSDGSIRPTPLDSTPVFIVAVLVLAFFAWQTHIPLTPLLLLEIALGLLFTALVIWIGRRLESEPFLFENSYQRIMLRVGSLLAPAILLWPRETLLDPLPLAIALTAAGLVSLATYYTLTPLLNLYAWFDDAETEVENPDELIHALLVRDLMDRDCVTIAKSTPVPEIARLFHEHRVECLPVIDAENHLMGIVTEHDLFVKEERLPRTDLTYQAVFKEPLTLEQLPKVYSQRGQMYTAADVMTAKVVWVKEASSIGQAVRLMVRHGFKCLPVLDSAPELGGKLVGVITRSGIIRLLVQAKPKIAHPIQD
jgi:CBS domain-containing protein